MVGLWNGSDQEILQNRSGKVPVPMDLAIQTVVPGERVEGYPRRGLTNVHDWHTMRQRSGSSLWSGGMSMQAFLGAASWLAHSRLLYIKQSTGRWCIFVLLSLFSLQKTP